MSTFNRFHKFKHDESRYAKGFKFYLTFIIVHRMKQYVHRHKKQKTPDEVFYVLNFRISI